MAKNDIFGKNDISSAPKIAKTVPKWYLFMTPMDVSHSPDTYLQIKSINFFQVGVLKSTILTTPPPNLHFWPFWRILVHFGLKTGLNGPNRHFPKTEISRAPKIAKTAPKWYIFMTRMDVSHSQGTYLPIKSSNFSKVGVLKSNILTTPPRDPHFWPFWSFWPQNRSKWPKSSFSENWDFECPQNRKNRS